MRDISIRRRQILIALAQAGGARSGAWVQRASGGGCSDRSTRDTLRRMAEDGHVTRRRRMSGPYLYEITDLGRDLARMAEAEEAHGDGHVYELGPAMADVLDSLLALEGATLATLREHTGRGDVTAIVQRLRRQGLATVGLEPREGRRGRRATLYAATPIGAAVLARYDWRGAHHQRVLVQP